MKKLAKLTLLWAAFFMLTGTLWAGYKLFFGFQKGGIVISSVVKETYWKVIISAHKGREQDYYLRRERKKFIDLVLETKGNSLTKIKRTYKQFVEETKPFMEKKIRKAKHPSQGLSFQVERKGRRDKVTILTKTARIPAPALKAINLDDEMSFLTKYLPKKSMNYGHSWNMPQKGVRKFLGDDWKNVRGTLKCTFVKKAFHKGHRCAKILVKMNIRGTHGMGANTKMKAKGYFYYSLKYGTPVSLKLEGDCSLNITQKAPNGQVAKFSANGPYKVHYYRDYQPPEEDDDDDEDEE